MRPKRTERVTLRLTPARRALLKRAANARRVAESDVLRRGLERELERELGDIETSTATKTETTP